MLLVINKFGSTSSIVEITTLNLRMNLLKSIFNKLRLELKTAVNSIRIVISLFADDDSIGKSLFVCLKEYYEIVGESRPLSAFFPTHADFFTEIHFYL